METARQSLRGGHRERRPNEPCCVRDVTCPGRYGCFMLNDDGEARSQADYGANFDRLAVVMYRKNPGNLLANQNSIDRSSL
jgi:hypothetical protein